jgi:hypothetical protein
MKINKMSKYSLSTWIKDYYIPLMDIPLEEELKNNFLYAIDKKDKKQVELLYPEILKIAIISGDHDQCRIFFNRMRFSINSELNTNFSFIFDSEFS